MKSCGAKYELAVERQQVRQGEKPDFQADSLPWGKWLVAHKIIENKGELYLRLQTTAGQRSRQPAKVICYRDSEGKFVSKEQIKPFFPKVSTSNKQEEAGLDKENQVMVRTYKFSSLKKIRVEGKTYLVNS